MSDVINELIKEFIILNYPIKRMRIDTSKRHRIKTKGNFKRVVKSPNRVYIISNNEQKYATIRSLSIILSRAFHIKQEDTIPLLKKHLRFRESLK